MGMTIDEVLKIIKDGRIMPYIIKGNNKDDTEFNKANIEALNVVIATMHKYQKIQEIVEHWACCGNPSDSMIAISEVLDNGNDD